MDHKSSEDIEEQDVDLTSGLPLDKELVFDEEEEREFVDSSDDSGESVDIIEPLAKKMKGRAVGRFSLKARRAIEDHLEKRRQSEDVDYLYDSHFTEKNKQNKE